jgi:hypothetical protein
VIFLEEKADGFDGEVVVFALREARDGDGTDDASSGDVDREAATVCGVVGVGEAVAFGELTALLFEKEADGVRRAMEACYDVDLSLNPALAVGGSAGECRVEELLVGLAEAADVDDDTLVAGEGQIAEGQAQLPGSVVVEGGEAEFGFLTGNEG